MAYIVSYTKLYLKLLDIDNIRNILYFAIFPDIDEIEEVLLNNVTNIIQKIIKELSE